ncbi:hypothetical protein GW17_00026348 [Ensete ventricosum]|nr:hypothetical protein GW17_00026348 [Ensete ventricosum]
MRVGVSSLRAGRRNYLRITNLIGRAVLDSRFSLFFSLFLLLPLLSPLVDTALNQLPTVEIDHYRPTAASDVEINRYQPISCGNKTEISPIDGTAR